MFGIGVPVGGIIGGIIGIVMDVAKGSKFASFLIGMFVGALIVTIVLLIAYMVCNGQVDLPTEKKEVKRKIDKLIFCYFINNCLKICISLLFLDKYKFIFNSKFHD